MRQDKNVVSIMGIEIETTKSHTEDGIVKTTKINSSARSGTMNGKETIMDF